MKIQPGPIGFIDFRSLEEIQKVVQSRSMPPWPYRMMHWEFDFNSQEIQKVFNWVRSSLSELGVQD